MPREPQRTHVVRADGSDRRAWLRRAPLCPALAEFRTAHCGIMHARHPLEIVRPALSGAFFLACFAGEGSVLIDGAWRRIEAGRACLQPPMIRNALRTHSRRTWSFCWVRYREPPLVRPPVSLHTPVLGSFDAAPLRAAVEGLHAEAAGTASPTAMRRWAELIHEYVLSFERSFRSDARLSHVWRIVAGRLHENWTLARLARLACTSREHLRRLSLQSLGRSPMHHTAFLRMHRAAELLEKTDRKIARIAAEVGYANAFAFSDAFLQWIGCRPSEYRRRLSSASERP